jgi:pyrroline-5-carboxylate reductase
MERITSDLCIIGGGNMARAIIDGGVASNVLDATSIIVAEPQPERRAQFLSRGVATFGTAHDALAELRARESLRHQAGLILLAVKPQVLAEVATDLAAFTADDAAPRAVISILAGKTTATLATAIQHPVHLIRAMPNTPAQVRQGATALCLGPNTTWEHASAAEALFGGVGPLVIRIDESLMDAFTAVAASGPAYLFFLAQAMIDAGVHLGFDRDTATRMVKQTLVGSAALFAESGAAPADLIAGVKSKGGTTEAALNVLARENVHDAVVAALTAARDRGRELAS